MASEGPAIAPKNLPSNTPGVFEKLYPDEVWWRDRSSTLEKHGYMLRPRFRPGWVPSWVGTDRGALDCEDGICNFCVQAIDAQRISDGQVVFIKRLLTNSREIKIAQFLSGPDKLKDPNNHCVPILDVFSADDLPGLSFMVMPLFRYFDDPPFHAVEEVLDFVQQTLEGLVFVHANNVAHRDLSSGNIMLDGKDMYPRGFHPALQGRAPSFRDRARAFRRNQVPRVKYYFIDWGISSWFTPEERKNNPLVVGDVSADPDVPELGFVPYDPFPVDIFTLGNVFKKDLLDKYTNLEFLRPLSETMTSQIPQDRPTAEASLTLFKEIIKPISGKERRWHLHPNPSYKTPITILYKPKYSHRRAEGLSQIREVVWKVQNRMYNLAGKKLVWPVPEPKEQSSG